MLKHLGFTAAESREKGSLCVVTNVTVNNMSFVEPGTGLVPLHKIQWMIVHKLHLLFVSFCRVCLFLSQQPKKKVTLYLLFCVSTAVIGSLQFGYNTGVMNAPEEVGVYATC